MIDFVTQASHSSSVTMPEPSSLANIVASIQVSPPYKALLAFIENAHDPTTFPMAVKDSKWCEAINWELRALESNGT